VHSLIRIALIVSGAAMAAAPPFELPAPTGASRVGTASWRLDAVGRPIEVHAWYPAAPGGEDSAPYLRDGPTGVRAFAAAIRGPIDRFEAMAGVRTHSMLDAPIAASPSQLPLLVFSHGYTAEPSAYTALLEDLASHGYIVFSIVHAYEAGETDRVFSEWKSEDETMAAITRASEQAEQLRLTRGYLAAIPVTTSVLGRWVNDIRVALDRTPERFAPRVDRARIGILGHSMGGVASAQFCLGDRRCRAGLNLDGIPQYGTVVDEDLGHPFLMVYSSRVGRAGANDVVYRRAAPTYYRVDVRDTLHLDFTDMVFWPTLRERKILGAMPAVRATELTRSIVREYFDQELSDRLSTLLSGKRREPELTVALYHRKPL
jgi:predicted dienelactone hydrolase